MQQSKRSIELYAKKYGKKGTVKSLGDETQEAGASGFESNTELLYSCFHAWRSLSTLRDEMRRNEEFVYGDQHSDKVYDPSTGRWFTERQMFMMQGLIPSQYNIVRGILRSIVGVYSSAKTLPTCVAQKDENQEESEVITATLHTLYRKNDLRKLTTSQLIQLLITGIAVTKNHYVNRRGDSDIVNDFVDPFAFFVDNTMKDPRYEDCTLVGCYWDMPVEEIAGKFSKGSKARAERIRQLYGNPGLRQTQMVETFTDTRKEKDFFTTETETFGLGRVIEAWRVESAECYWVHDYLRGEYYPDFTSTETQLKAENKRRMDEQSALGVAPENMLLLDWGWGIDSFWKYYYMTPYGDVLDSGVNPFWHEKPPFVFEFHEFFVGKIYPFVKDLIDANKQVNKLSAISELLTKYSAKQLMLIPLETVADEEGYGVEEIERRTTKYDAVIPYKSKGTNSKPEFISTIDKAFTPLNVVNMYLKLSENVSGVYGALQGQAANSGTPAQLYAQQSQNSATNLNGVFDIINSFRMRGDKMNVQLMQQFYDEKRYIFDKQGGKNLLWDPEKVKNIDTEISLTENTDTPAYRLMVNDVMMQLKQFDVNNELDFRGMIEVGALPMKEKLLDYLNKRQQEMQDAQAQGMPYQGTPMPEDLQQGLAGYQYAPNIQQQMQGIVGG